MERTVRVNWPTLRSSLAGEGNRIQILQVRATRGEEKPNCGLPAGSNTGNTPEPSRAAAREESVAMARAFGRMKSFSV